MILVKNMIENQIHEEQSDHDLYEDLATQLEVEGYSGYASIVRDIAREECTHKKHLESIIEDMH